MKTFPRLRPLHLLVFLAGCFGQVTAAPYGPDGRSTSWVQPNGSEVQLRVFGDEFYGRTENAAGYTVVYNAADSTYYYARLSQDGRSLVPAPVRADQPAPAGLAKHAELPAKEVRRISEGNHAKYAGEREQRWNKRVQAVRKVRAAARSGQALQGAEAAEVKIQAAPVLGALRGLTILIQFPDDSRTSKSDPENFPTNQVKMGRFCNDRGYQEDGNTGSVRDYFLDQSLGKLDYTQSVTQVITMPRPRNYYNFSDWPNNRNLRDDSGRVLLLDAITLLKSANFDFSNLTTDAARRVLATNMFFAGKDSGVFASGLWPYSWSLAADVNVGTAAAPIYISAFQMTNMPNASPVIGTFCHENGHLILDYPDLYAQIGQGVGEHCLMGSGNYLNGGRTPSPINIYLKDLVGWANVTDITPAEYLTVALPTTGNVGYRLRNAAMPTESFMVENRGSGDKWARFSRDKGVAVWHIDETVDGNLRTTTHYGVALMQADGQADLESGRNRGDGGDLFDLARPRFSDTTIPGAAWWDASASSVRIQVLTAAGAQTDVTFGAVPPNTIIVRSPNGGEVIYPDSRYPVRWEANVVGNLKLDLYKAGVFHSVIATGEVNDGNFTWNVPASLIPSNDYSLQISSLTNPIRVSDVSNAPFAINNATFPADGKMPYGWFRPKGAATSWQVTKSTSYEGKFSLVSRKARDGKSAGVAYRSDFKAGNVSFYMKVSSEVGYDFGRFYIDGVLQSFENADSGVGLTGRTDWVFASFPISAGTHTFKWTFEKDDSYAGLQEGAWLDGVTFPDTTQEIAVADPQGVDIADGASSTSFPAIPIGSTGSPQLFTISNNGRADLHGIRVVTVGASAGDFAVRNLGTAALRPGASTTFEVVFAPTRLGPHSAGIQILSNDADESAFAIGLQGTGLGVPVLGVYLGADSQLKDNGKPISFGTQFVGTTGKTKTLTVKNQGSSEMSGLGVTLKDKGKGKADFLIGELGATTLAPGASTTFTVTFHPKSPSKREAEIHLASNDTATGIFNIKLTGKGVPKKSNIVSKHSAPATGSAAQSATAASLASTSIEVIDGEKFLALTVRKQPGSALNGTVEVSSDLLDWFSGKKHTTVVIDNAASLKVRDNTPLTPGVKRHIRLK